MSSVASSTRIEYRGYGQEIVDDLGAICRGAGLERAHRRVPPDPDPRRRPHDDRVLATSRSTQIAFCYLGDARNNMGNSLLVGGSQAGHGCPACARPKHLWPNDDLLAICRERGRPHRCPDHPHRERRRGSHRASTSSTPMSGSRWARTRPCGMSGSNCSSPIRSTCDARRADRQPGGQVHALPAGLPRPRDQGRPGDLRAVRTGRHGGHRTRCSSRERSIVWDQAENRMHTIKAIMVATLGT